jgi:hypothetical protein
VSRYARLASTPGRPSEEGVTRSCAKMRRGWCEWGMGGGGQGWCRVNGSKGSAGGDWSEDAHRAYINQAAAQGAANQNDTQHSVKEGGGEGAHDDSPRTGLPAHTVGERSTRHRRCGNRGLQSLGSVPRAYPASSVEPVAGPHHPGGGGRPGGGRDWGGGGSARKAQRARKTWDERRHRRTALGHQQRGCWHRMGWGRG